MEQVLKIPSLVPVLSQMNPIHILTTYFFKTNFNIIYPSAPISPNWQLPSRFSDYSIILESRDSSVGIALGYGLDDRGSRVRFSAGAGNFSLHHRVQHGSGVHPATYPIGTRGSFPGGKAAGA
jgi:hypothetical protein